MEYIKLIDGTVPFYWEANCTALFPIKCGEISHQHPVPLMPHLFKQLYTVQNLLCFYTPWTVYKKRNDKCKLKLFVFA